MAAGGTGGEVGIGEAVVLRAHLQISLAVENVAEQRETGKLLAQVNRMDRGINENANTLDVKLCLILLVAPRRRSADLSPSLAA